MPRNTSDANIQPGRVMIMLKDAFVPDDLIHDILVQQGEVAGMHRPENNKQLVFVQYADPDIATNAISKLRNYPLFRVVDQAIKSERYQENNPNDMPQKKQQNKQFNKNRNSFNNFRRSDGFGNRNSSDMDSPPRQRQTGMDFQPEIPLGCWYCTKMPSFECRCGAFYCDIGCQRADWPKHKDICMPRLVPISYSNKLILQEAVASKNASSISSTPYSPSSPEYGSNSNSNQPQRQSQQKTAQNRSSTNDSRKSQPQQKQQQQQPQQPQQQQQQQQNGHGPAKQEDLVNKLQRMKLSKTAGSAPSPGQKRILEPGRFPPEGARVKITTSLESGTIYIYHNNGQHGAQSDFQTLINRLHKAAEDESRPLEAAPRPDDVVFALFQGMYYRAKVLAVKDTKIDVQFPDFGNLDTVAWKEALEITNEELKWAKFLAFPVTLEGVEGPLTKEQKQLVEALEFEEEFELVKTEPQTDSELRQVVLRRERQNVTLNMALVELREKEQRLRRQREEQKREKERLEKEEREKRELAEKIPDPETYKPLLFDEIITVKQLTADRRYTLCIIDASEVFDSRLISVIAAEDAPAYGAVVQDCERYGQADPHEYRPKVRGEVCLGRYKADWSRVLYDEDDSSLLLDVGNMVCPDEFRRFPPALGRVVYNNEVIVENFPLLEKMMVDKNPESIHGHTIDAWVAASDGADSGTLGIRIIPGANN